MNLSRIIQNWFRRKNCNNDYTFTGSEEDYISLKKELSSILDRIYRYHIAYNELLWEMNDANLLPAYSAGFIHLNKQYLTVGLNGLNQAAEFLGISCNPNSQYSKFCQEIFSLIKSKNTIAARELEINNHKLSFNTELVPAESLAVKNYNWDKEDGYWVPEDTNLYASYIFKPNDPKLTILDKVKLHGSEYIGDFLDGGSAAHLNLDSHLSSEQYKHILEYAAKEGCTYLTFNIPMTKCKDCGKIYNVPVEKCHECGSENTLFCTRIIGYLTYVKNWHDGRKTEFSTRVFSSLNGHKTFTPK